MTLEGIEQAPSRRKRALNMEVAERRAAVAFLRPTIAQFQKWQLTAARLVGIGERSKARGEHNPEAELEATALCRAIELQRQSLAQQLQSAPLAVRNHGRVSDCLKAFDSLAICASRAQFLLERRSDG